MSRFLTWLGLRDPKSHPGELVEETRMLRGAMQDVADQLHDVAESVREVGLRHGPSNIPWQDMSRGISTRRRDHDDRR